LPAEKAGAAGFFLAAFPPALQLGVAKDCRQFTGLTTDYFCQSMAKMQPK